MTLALAPIAPPSRVVPRLKLRIATYRVWPDDISIGECTPDERIGGIWQALEALRRCRAVEAGYWLSPVHDDGAAFRNVVELRHIDGRLVTGPLATWLESQAGIHLSQGV